MIHKYSLFGANIVIDVNSGAIHVLDDTAYKVLDFVKDRNLLLEDCLSAHPELSREEVLEAFSEIKNLIDEDLLFTNDYMEKIAQNYDKDSVIKALCLHICHDCNLRCKYCFANTGDFKGKRSMMSFEVGKEAIDFVISESRHRKNIEIDYFGGEPLMNFEVVKKITEYAIEEGKKHNKNFRFTLTTNGLLLNEEKIKYINEYMSNVVLSIDGRPEVNDFMRPTVSGGGTYDLIVEKFKEIAALRNQDNYYVRGTFTRNNLDFYEDVIHLANLGFEQISVEPVVLDRENRFAIKEEDLPKIFENYEKLALEIARRKKEGKGFNFFHFMLDTDGGPCVYKRLSGCGAGHEYVAITPKGEIYPCHQFVGIEEFKLGDVFSKKINKELGDKFRKSNVYTKEECKSCWAKFYCSGGCFANAYNQNGDMDKPYKIGCEMQKKRVECAIAIAAMLA